MASASASLTRRSPVAAAGMHPALMYQAYLGLPKTEVPDIIEFALSDRYLNRTHLFPRQATILKVVFLQTELFTAYDEWVIEQWVNEYERTENHGISPDVEERIQTSKDWGRKWLREVVAAVGRRGSKGHLGGISGAYVLWNYLALGNPQAHYGIDEDKRLTSIVFAAKKGQARDEQWRDLVNVILGGRCFQPYISQSLAESLTVRAPIDFRRMAERESHGVDSSMDQATFSIVPKESTATAGRGPAAFMQHYDEMAHVVAAGANRSAEEVWDAATPALDQFRPDEFIWEGSSPWQMTGQFYANYQNALARHPDGSGPISPDSVMLQLHSWDPYEDWEMAEQLGLGRAKRPIQTYDEKMKSLEKIKPETFKVERLAQFATVLDVYLPTEKVEALFKPWDDRVLEYQTRGRLDRTYKAHADPGKSNDRFGFAIAHTEPDPEDPEIKHVVFDVIHAWDPADAPDHQLDYVEIEEDLWDYVERFMPYELTFDQWNSASIIAKFRRKAMKESMPKRVDVYEKTATMPLNWKRWETFKTALGMGWIHAPPHEVAELELKFLQEKPTQGQHGKVDHPDAGPVQSKDVADAMCEVVYGLIGSQVEAMVDALSGMSLDASQQGGMSPYPNSEEDIHEAMSGFSSTRGQISGLTRSMRGQALSRGRGRHPQR